VTRVDITGLLSEKFGNWYTIRKVWEPLPYTMSTGSLIPILRIFAFKMQGWTFWCKMLLCESPVFGTILDK